MFMLIINISSSSGGVTLSSQLSEIRSNLGEVSNTIRDLESNFILLLVHPEIVILNNAKKSKEGSGEEGTTSQAVIVRNYSTDPSEILNNLSEAWSLKKVLFSNEYYLVQKIMELLKEDNNLLDLPIKTI